MVTALEAKQVETRQITLEEQGRELGLPIKVRPWWGSVRHSFLPLPVERHIRWPCPAEFQNRKKNPEIQGGKIVLWEGQCHYDKDYRPHTHTQIIEVKDARYQAMLITIRLDNVKASLSQFLLGMDSGQPYVVQVGLCCQTTNEALSWLVPKMVKSAIAQGLDVKRQGDWFFIPHNREPNLHEWDDRLIYGLYKRNHLYRNYQLVYSRVATRHRATLVVYNSVNGLPCEAPVVKGKVRAPDHDPLVLDRWHLAVRNRSHPHRNARANNHDD